MACIFFRPGKQSGCASGGQPLKMGSLCQDGYVRGRCPDFPDADNLADAIEVSAALENQRCITIRYSLERNYLPLYAGEHSYNWESREWSPRIVDDHIEAHMKAYLDQIENLKLEFESERTK